MMDHIARIKKAELLSSIGAGVLGAGIALLWAEKIAPYAVTILIAGLVAHSTGMFQKHRLERQNDNSRLWWGEAFYWLCWLALGGLFLYIIVQQF